MMAKRKAGGGSKAAGRLKKKKLDEEEEWFAGVLSKDDIGPALISKVYHLLDECQKKRHNLPCKDNPNCFEMMGQSELATKTKELPDKLGPNPNENMRAEGFPVGLKNLGATCYMNSLVQSLFMNTTFRQGIYDWAGTEADDKLLFQLKNLFAHLQYSASRYHDPVSFLQSTEISSAVQQDVQEFFKMIITYIEEHSKPHMSTLVEKQFKGKIAYNTECKKCHTKSVKECEFYELELNVKGCKTIEDSLKTYVKEEEMTGQNHNCESLQDGGRSISIREPPCVLSVQLLRFVYDMQTYTKKKVRDSISFPMVIDLKPFIDSKPSTNPTAKDSKPQSNLHTHKVEPDPEPDKMDVEAPNDTNGNGVPVSSVPSNGEPPTRATRGHAKPATSEASSSTEVEYIYELTSVMMHRGLTAYGGHYVVHVKDECTGKWWQFNDEDVRPIEDAKVGVIDDTAYEASTPSTPSTPPQQVPEGDGTPDSPFVMASPSKRKGKTAAKKTAKGKKAAKGKGKTKDGENEEDSGEGEKAKDKDSQDKGRISSTTAYMLTYARRGRSIVPTAAPETPIVEAICKEMEEVKVSAQEYSKMLTSETDRLTARKLLFEEIQAKITPEDKQPFNWISSEWLSEWIKCSTEVLQIDNTKIVCQHNKTDPNKIDEMKRISREVWNVLNTGEYQGGPTLTEEDFCTECIYTMCQDEKESTISHKEKLTLLEELADNDEDVGFYISKNWFKDFSKNSPPDDLGKDMTSELMCEHGNLTTNSKLIKLIPQKSWEYLRLTFDGGPLFPSSTTPCELCLQQDSQDRELGECRRKVRQVELKSMREFYTKVKTRTSDPLTNEPQYIVSYPWALRWKEWLDNPESDDTLGIIDNSGLLCPHEKLLYDPTFLAEDRLPNDTANMTIKTTGPSSETSHPTNGTSHDKPSTNSTTNTTATTITSTQSPALTSANGDKTVIDLSGPSPPDSLPFLVVKAKIGEQLAEKYGFKPAIKCTTYTCSPSVCHECLTSRQLQEAEERVNYTDGHLFVQQASGDGRDAPALQKRSSTRYRLRDKNPKRKVTPINAQKDTVQKLKLKIYELLDVAPFQQALWFGDTLLDNDSAPISSYRIPLGADLTLVVVEGDQELLEENANKGQCEEGFKGSIFYSKPKDSPASTDAAPLAADTVPPALALSSDSAPPHSDASSNLSSHSDLPQNPSTDSTTTTSTIPSFTDTTEGTTYVSTTDNNHHNEDKDVSPHNNIDSGTPSRGPIHDVVMLDTSDSEGGSSTSSVSHHPSS